MAGLVGPCLVPDKQSQRAVTADTIGYVASLYHLGELGGIASFLPIALFCSTSFARRIVYIGRYMAPATPQRGGKRQIGQSGVSLQKNSAPKIRRVKRITLSEKEYTGAHREAWR